MHTQKAKFIREISKFVAVHIDEVCYNNVSAFAPSNESRHQEIEVKYGS